MKAKFTTMSTMMLAFFVSLPFMTQAVSASELNPGTILQFPIKEEHKVYTFENNTIATDSTNLPLKGWNETNGTTSYYENGVQVSGWNEIDGVKYYFDDEGSLQTGEISVNGKTFYLSDEGELVTGWKNNKTEYYRENGQQVISEQIEIDGDLYYFDEKGKMVTGKAVEGYEYGNDGVGTRIKTNYDKIAEAALAQLGVAQDCTRLVSNSLLAVGINFHGAPYKYASLGEWTDNPVPGDICIYNGHVAIYIGDGMAVHGGWNGGTTAIYTVECSTPFIGYIHVDESLMNISE